jgi:hypothetical protein
MKRKLLPDIPEQSLQTLFSPLEQVIYRRLKEKEKGERNEGRKP